MIKLLFGVCHRMQNVGEQGHIALLGHSLAAYISVLDRERLRKLTTRILSDTTLWLCRLFRYNSTELLQTQTQTCVGCDWWRLQLQHSTLHYCHWRDKTYELKPIGLKIKNQNAFYNQWRCWSLQGWFINNEMSFTHSPLTVEGFVLSLPYTSESSGINSFV